MRQTILIFLPLLIFSGISTFAAAEDGCSFPEEAPALTSHLYGTWPGEFDINTLYPEFCKVFELWITDRVAADWTQQNFHDFINGVLDNDITDTSDDCFAIVWDYFCYVDEDPSYPEIRYLLTAPDNPNPIYCTKIKITLFGTGDRDPENSTAGDDYLLLNSNANGTLDGVLGQAFAHELQHLCHLANQKVYSIAMNPTDFYFEAIPTLAEHMVGSYRSNAYYDYPYDSSVYPVEQCDHNRKYVVFKAFMMYVYETFLNSPADITDDVFYQWLRFPSLDPSHDIQIDFKSLSELLWSPEYDYLGGGNSDERFKNFFENFAAAKFANAPDVGDNHLFGYPTGHTVLDLHFFQDRCTYVHSCGGTPATPDPSGECPENIPNWYTPTPGCHVGCWNVRILPPTYEVTSADENNMTTISGIYEDADGSRDWIDVALYGTDYIVFNAGADYQDGQQHEFRFEMNGNVTSEWTQWLVEPEVRMCVIGYNSSVEPLQVHPENIVFLESAYPQRVESTADEWEATVIVPEFGRQIQSVVIVMTVVEENIGVQNIPGLFEYEYKYGVYDHDGSVTWKGDVYLTGDVTIQSGHLLTMEEGCYVHIANQDYSQGGIMPSSIEITINGSLEVDGSLFRPVTLRPMLPTGMGDWFGVYLLPGSGGGTITHATVTNANIGIMSAVPITVNSSAFTDNFSGLSLSGCTGTIDNSYFADNMMGLQCAAADPVVSNSSFIENSTGVYASGNPILGQIVGETLIGGYNRFYNNAYHINNCNPSPVYAQQNYWFIPTCPPSYKFIGDVICEPPLPTDPLNPGGGGDKRKWPHDPPAGSSWGEESRPQDFAEQFKLVNAYPNPFNPSISISYSVPAGGGVVRISIYDVEGRKLTDLVDGFKNSGTHETRWDGHDRNGARVSSGIYFVKMIAGNYTNAKKIVMLK